MHPGEAASPGQAALPQEEQERGSAPVGQGLLLWQGCRSQESSMAVGGRDNSPLAHSSGWLRVNFPRE